MQGAFFEASASKQIPLLLTAWTQIKPFNFECMPAETVQAFPSAPEVREQARVLPALQSLQMVSKLDGLLQSNYREIILVLPPSRDFSHDKCVTQHQDGDAYWYCFFLPFTSLLLLLSQT